MPMEKIKNVLEKYCNASAVFQSPYQEDKRRTVNYDSDGNELISYPVVDGSEIVKANGSFLNWSLNALLSAGINPDFAIHTGFSSRLDGYSSVLEAVSSIESLLPEESSDSNDVSISE